MPGNNEDKKQELPDQKMPQVVAEFKQCPVCAIRQAIKALIDLILSYGVGPTRADTEKLKSTLKKLQEDLDVANHAGIDRFGETLGKEAKKKGHMAPEYEFYTTIVQGPVRQQSWESKIPYGASITALWVGLDTCIDCGTVFGVKLIKGVAIKPAIPPGGRQTHHGHGLFLGHE